MPDDNPPAPGFSRHLRSPARSPALVCTAPGGEGFLLDARDGALLERRCLYVTGRHDYHVLRASDGSARQTLRLGPGAVFPQPLQSQLELSGWCRQGRPVPGPCL